MAMANVLTDPDMVKTVFSNIDDPDYSVTMRTLTRWCAVSRFVRNACKPYDALVWFEFMDRTFKECIEFNGGALALAMATDHQHPRTYVKTFHRVLKLEETFLPPFARPVKVSAYHIFLRYIRREYNEHRLAAAGARIDVQFFFPWSDQEWRALEPWKRAMFEGYSGLWNVLLAKERALMAASRAARGWSM